MKKLLLLTFLGISVLACKDNSEKEALVTDNSTKNIQDKIAMANGFQEFDSIQKLNFTFNVKVNDSLRSSRQWVWNLKSHKISLTENDSVMSYVKKDSLADDKKQIDQKFVNDSYWLLFPYQLKWSNAEFTEPKIAKAPISGDELQMITVSYPKGGYTPGDSYDIYYDDDYMIKEWVYKAAGGGREMATTWEDYGNFKGIKISKMHKTADGNFELYFTDISVEKD